MSFSQEQRVFIIEQYFTSRSYACVIDEILVKYPGVVVLENWTIMRLFAFFRESVSVLDKKRIGRTTILAEVKNVMLSFAFKNLEEVINTLLDFIY